VLLITVLLVLLIKGETDMIEWLSGISDGNAVWTAKGDSISYEVYSGGSPMKGKVR